MENIKKTSLHQKHLELKAKMAPFAGFDMPLQYSSVKLECQAVREAVGVFDVSHMGEFFVTGPDAIKFVDYMLTNDFAAAAMNKAVYSPLCRDNGTIIDDLIAYKLGEERVLICVNASNIEKDYAWFEKHVSDFNCSLKNESNEYSLLALQGPQSEEILKTCEILSKENFDYYSANQVTSPIGDLILARTGYTGEDGFEIFGNHESIKKLWIKFLDLKVVPCGLAARDVLRLEVGYPLYGHELSDDWTPLDAGLKWTVKLNKGSFIGKNALENYEPKFRLVKLSLESAIPRADYEILDDNSNVIGKVTSGTMSVANSQGIALGLIEKTKFPENKSFHIRVRKNIIKANFHSKAFVSGGHK